MADGIPTDPPTSRTIDFGALVRKALGDEFHKHEKVYHVGRGRTFESSDYGTQGIYRAKTAIVRSGTSQTVSDSAVTLDSDANGSAFDYVGRTISLSKTSPDTGTATIVDYNETSRIARVVPTLTPFITTVEGARTNLCLRSEEFDNAAWSATEGNVAANDTVSPDGATTADKLTATGTGEVGYRQATSQSGATAYAISMFAKRSTNRWIYIRNLALDNWASYQDAGAWFDLQNGVVGTKGSLVTSSSIIAYPNGWYRCSMVGTTAGIIIHNNVDIKMSNADNVGNANTVGLALWTWGAQLEAAAFASSYIPTTTAAVTRSVDQAAYTISVAPHDA